MKKKSWIFRLLSILVEHAPVSRSKGYFHFPSSVIPPVSKTGFTQIGDGLNGGGRNLYPRKAHGSFRFKTKLIGASNDRHYFIVTPF